MTSIFREILIDVGPLQPVHDNDRQENEYQQVDNFLPPSGETCPEYDFLEKSRK